VRQIVSWFEEPTDEPHGSTLTEFRKDEAARESFATIGAQQANAQAGGYRHVAPGQVGHEFVAGGEANAILAEHISRKAAGSEYGTVFETL
jgi:hypothetical protein